jgi:hypothetical protein
VIQTRRLFYRLALAGLLLMAWRRNAPWKPASSAPGTPGPTFRDFNGVVNLPAPEVVRQLGLGWTRADFGWGNVEPEKGKWVWDKTDQLVQTAHGDSMEILPVLDYTAPWAEAVKGQQQGPPEHTEDWEDYVDHVVARYSHAPFNLRYFQIWNEPTREAGFWRGSSNRDFIDTIYLPAAKIIRRYNARVVFSGWPHSNSLGELDGLLNNHDAWRLTDILDVHYFGGSAWQHLYDYWLLAGRCSGIWQTEIGFTDNPDYLPNAYLRSLNWALRSGWKDPDQYKVFWYANWGAGHDADKCLSKTDHGKIVLTENGQRLAVMNGTLGDGVLASFTQFTTTPPLAPTLDESKPTALGFKVGENRTVVALLLNKVGYQGYSSVSVRASLGFRPKHVEVVTASGQRHALDAIYTTGGVQVAVPLKSMLDECSNCAWIVAYLEFEAS